MVTGKSSKSTCKNKAIADALGNDEFDVDCPPFELSKEELEEKGGVQWLFETSNSLKALRRRKGDLFTVKQEAQVKELFEQYQKDPKCCHLLAQAIDSEGKITAAQVRRKLKLFGLSPLGEESKSRNQTLKGRDSTDVTSSDHTKEQGNTKSAVRRKKRAVETLSSSEHMKDQRKTKRAVKRKKRVVETVAVDTQDSDNETLTQMMEKMQQNNGGIAEIREKNLATNPLVKANENKAKKRKELKSSRKMEPAREKKRSEDETLQDLLNRRSFHKKAAGSRKGENVSGVEELERGSMPAVANESPSQKTVIKRRRRTIRKVGGSDMLLQSSDQPSLLEDDDEHPPQQHRHQQTRRRNLVVLACEED